MFSRLTFVTGSRALKRPAINYLENIIKFFFMEYGGKRADVAPDGERLPPPMDTRNTHTTTQVRYRPWDMGRRMRGRV